MSYYDIATGIGLCKEKQIFHLEDQSNEKYWI